MARCYHMATPVFQVSKEFRCKRTHFVDSCHNKNNRYERRNICIYEFLTVNRNGMGAKETTVDNWFMQPVVKD